MKKRKTKLFLMSCLMACMLWATKTNATTCGSATLISPGSLPISGQSVVCGGTNDITYAATAASVKTGGCANSSYYGGQEALYVFTPTTTGVYNIALSGQTWTMIMVTWGCPTTAGSTCVDGIANSSSSKNINVVLFAGQTYYIMFDTYPTPNSPCPGTFSMSFVGPPPTTPSPWSESFPSATLPTGWALSSYFGPSNSITALNTGGSSTYYLYKNIYSVGTSGGSFTTINVGPLAGTEELSFKYKLANYVGPYGPPAAGSGNFTVDISTNYGFTYTNIATVSNNGLAGWQDVNYSLAAYSGQYVKIKITGNWTSGDYYLGFDDFKIELPPTCSAPTAPSGSPTTATTANISWTAPGIPPSNGYEYAVTTSATPPGSGTPFPGTSTSVSGLTANTTYYLHVRSDCGGSGFSTWATSAPFTTPCLPASLPWSENFDGVTIPAFPSCWVKENGDWVTTNNSNSSYDADAHSGTQFLRNAWSATNEYMWTPGFTLTAGNTYEFKFWWAGDNYSGWTGDVFVNSAQSSSGATQLGTSFVTSGTTTTKTYVQETYPFTPGTTGDYYFAIRVNATASPWYLSFDDFEVSQLVACSGMPSGGTAGASINPVCSGANFDLSLTGASSGEAGLTYQWQSADDAAFTVNLTNLGTGETQTTSQTSDKYYRCIVTCTNSGLSATSTAVLVTMNTDACQCNTYCSSNFTSATYEFVTNVTFAGINNSSAGNIGGPVDYTNLSASVQQGGTYPLSVTIDADASDYVYAWIDWNGDGDFDDAGETYTLATATSSPGPHSLNIMVPCTATVGSTRMRVMVDWNNANPDPCRSATFGEAEDYCVSIAVNPVSATITGNPTGCSPVSLTASGGSTYLWSGGASPNSATNSFTASGTYTVTVTDNGCSATASETVTITPEPTANITGGGALCLGNSGVVILNFTGTAPWSYTVTGSGGPYSGLTSNASENVSVTPSAGGSQSYTVSVSDANCTGTGSGTATFEVSTAPPLTSAKEPLVPVSACSGTITLVTTQLISGQNIEYSWNTGSSSSVVLFSTSNLGPWSPGPFKTTTNQVYAQFGALGAGMSGYNICVQGQNGCGVTNNKCEFVRGTATVPAGITGSSVQCSGAINQTYSVPVLLPPGVETYVWSFSVPGAVITPIDPPLNSQVNIDFPAFTTGILSVQSGLFCLGSSLSAPRNLVISNAPATPAVPTGPVKVCPGQTYTYSVPPIFGATTYNWTIPANATQVGGGTTKTIDVQFNATPINFSGQILSVSTTSICGATSGTRSKTIASLVPATPGIMSGPLTSACNGPFTYSVAPVSGVTYNWTWPIGVTNNTPNGFNSINLQFPNNFTTGQVSVTGTAAGCAISSNARTVNVKGVPATPGSITAVNPPCAYQPGDFTTSPVTGATGYNWQISPNNGTTIDNGQGTNSIDVTWGAGTATVIVTALNGCGQSGSRTLSYTPGCRLSGEPAVESDLTSLTVYPNPANNHVTVAFNAAESGKYVINLMDVTGRGVAATVVNAQAGINAVEFNLNTYAKGIYMLELRSGNNVEKAKLVIE